MIGFLKKYYYLFAAGLGIVCAVLAAVFGMMNAYQILYMPMELIALPLRLLSDAGTAGRIISVALLAVLCAVPIVIALVNSIRKKRFYIIQAFLLAAFGFLFFMLYLFITPQRLNNQAFNPALATVDTGLYKIILAMVFYSLISVYITLRSSMSADRGSEVDYLVLLLKLLAAFALVYIFYVRLFDTIYMIKGYAADPLLIGSEIPVNIIIAIVGYLAFCVPYVMTFYLVYRFILLYFRTSAADKPTVRQKLALHSEIVLTVALLCGLTFNLLQLYFFSQIQHIAVNAVEWLLLVIISFGGVCALHNTSGRRISPS